MSNSGAAGDSDADEDDGTRATGGASASNFVNEALNDGGRADAAPTPASLPRRIGAYMLDLSVFLGRGAYSVVYQGRHAQRRDERVAIKAVKLNRDRAATYHAELKINRIVTEHRNIVQLIDHSAPTVETGFMVFELCTRGDIFRNIKPNVGMAPRSRIGATFAQLVAAVAHIHRCGVCHLDVKPENLFVAEDGTVKLGDFGLSALAEDGVLHGCRGSYSYAAPENLRSKAWGVDPDAACRPPGQQGYDGQRADMWSVGVVLFVLLFGYTPWDAAHDMSVEFRMYRVMHGAPQIQPWNRMPTAFRSLFSHTIAVRPGRRWTAEELRGYISRDLGWHAPLAS